MDCTITDLPYKDTGYFSNILNAYIHQDSRLLPFIKYPVSFEGLASAVHQRMQLPVDRTLLSDVLQEQYRGMNISGKVAENIDLLSRPNTFTVCTAHQPAIFTGNLFFIYKIAHAIRLAEELSTRMPDRRFVPVFYMGSEDADLDELGNIFMNGEKIVWNTAQQGAIGRMQTEGLEKIIERIEGELIVNPHGQELIALLKACYLNSPDIGTATLKLVHHLFGRYGLLVINPDNARLKKQLIPVFEDELLNQTSSGIVSKSVAQLAESFKVQAQPRDINLFYLKGDIRKRIERRGEEWRVVDTQIVFDRQGILKELYDHPERFSPNVILRGIFQETILPNVAFIGGGGELAYWLELKALFEHYHVSYPVLVVRNSFLIIEGKWKEKMDRLRLPLDSIFLDEQTLLNKLVERDSGNQLNLSKEISYIGEYYNRLKQVTAKVDVTLGGHVDALRVRTIKPLENLEKKMLKAERRKFEDTSRQLEKLRRALFPNNGLQERVDNFMPFYSKWGNDFIAMIHDHSFTIEQQFRVLVVK